MRPAELEGAEHRLRPALGHRQMNKSAALLFEFEGVSNVDFYRTFTGTAFILNRIA